MTETHNDHLPFGDCDACRSGPAPFSRLPSPPPCTPVSGTHHTPTDPLQPHLSATDQARLFDGLMLQELLHEAPDLGLFIPRIPEHPYCNASATQLWLDGLDFTNPQLQLCVTRHQLKDGEMPHGLPCCELISLDVPIAQMRTVSFVLEMVHGELWTQYRQDWEGYTAAVDDMCNDGDGETRAFYRPLLDGGWSSICEGCARTRVADSGIRETMWKMALAKRWLDAHVRMREDAEEELAQEEEMVVVKEWTDSWTAGEEGEV